MWWKRSHLSALPPWFHAQNRREDPWLLTPPPLSPPPAFLEAKEQGTTHGNEEKGESAHDHISLITGAMAGGSQTCISHPNYYISKRPFRPSIWNLSPKVYGPLSLQHPPSFFLTFLTHACLTTLILNWEMVIKDRFNYIAKLQDPQTFYTENKERKRGRNKGFSLNVSFLKEKQ